MQQPSAQTPIDEIRAAARALYAAGLFPLQLAPPDAPKVEDGGWCRSPGKQVIGKGWQDLEVPEDPGYYRTGANLGVRTGPQPAGVFLVVIDVDTPDLQELAKIAPSGSWPETLVSKTGRVDGGYHFFYTWPSGLQQPRNGVKLCGADGQKTLVDIRSAGGQVVVAPSTHPSGNRYRWVVEADIAELPIEIAQTILAAQSAPRPRDNRANANGHSIATSPVAVAVNVPESGGELYPVSDGRWRTVCRRLSNKSTAVAMAFENLLHHRPIAEHGGRDDMLTKMCWALAVELPNADPASIAQHFEEQLSLLHALQPFSAPCDIAAKFRSAALKLSSQTSDVQLLASATGTPVACAHNVFEVLRKDAAMCECWSFDQFSNQIMIRRALPWDKGLSYPRAFADTDITHLTAFMMKSHRLNVSNALAYECIRAIAEENGYHPIQEYILGLRWDGVARLDTWLTDLLGVADSEYVRKAGAWWLMSAVERIANPGCQADYCLILEGEQGRRKSQALKALASPAWFSDSVSAFNSKDAALDIAGKWIVELGELSSIHSAKDVNLVKLFISRTTDRFRPPYGKSSIDLPRQCLFAGTTNDAEYLQDNTGNRRFWPVRVGQIDLDKLRELRDQLWAEAAVRLAQGERHWPETASELELFEGEVAERQVVDSLEDKFADWLEKPVGYHGQPLSLAWFAEHVAGIESPKRGDDARINAVLRKLGFRRKGRHWATPNGWVAPSSLPALAPVLSLPTTSQQQQTQQVKV